MGARGGTDDRDIRLGDHLNETRRDSSAGGDRAADGADHARPAHRHGVDARGVASDAQGRRARCGPGGSEGLRGGSGGEPVEPARAVQVRDVPCAAGPAGPHREGRWQVDPAHRHTDAGGQAPAARGRDGARTGLRAGFSGLLVRVPATALGARCAAAVVVGDDAPRGLLDDRSRHPPVLRRRG